MGIISGSNSKTKRRRRSSSSVPWTVRIQGTVLAVAGRACTTVFGNLLFLADPKAGATPSPGHSTGAVRSGDITIDASRGIWARVFCPAAASAITDDGDADAPPARLPVIVYLHGGGFARYSASSLSYDAFCRRLCRELRAIVVSVDYRLAPEHRFPAAYDDAVAALRYLDETPTPLPVNVDLSSCFLVGDSSGANMVHHVAQRWATTSSRWRRFRLAGAILIQPFFGGEERTAAELAHDMATRLLTVARADRYWREFLPEGATRDHPAARVCGDGVEIAEAFPPAMVVSGGIDLLKDWHAKYVEALQAKGKQVRVVSYPDAFHGFYVFPDHAASGKIIQDMKLFVDDHHRSASG